MIFRPLSIVGLIATFCCAAIAHGQTAQIIKHGKQCTALVVVHQGTEISWGSAFCVSPLGFYVTNAHVIPPTNVQRQVVPGGFTRQVIPGRGIVTVPRGGRVITRPVQTVISLVLNPGEADQAVYGATITKIDRTGDLAVLYITPKEALPTLELGDVDGLFETAPITAFGYPFGQMLADKPEDYPNISVNVGRITSLRKTRGELSAIQLDASLNPGNSGGPILDEKGKIIGIVERGIPGALINFAIPVTKLAKFLEVPMASFTVTRDTKNLAKPATITMRVLAVAPDAMKDATVDVELTRDNTPTETFKATSDAENVYKVTAPVVVESEAPATQATTHSQTQVSDGSAATQPSEPAPPVAAPATQPQLPFHQVKFAVVIRRPGKEDGRNEGMFSIPLSEAENSARLAAAARTAQENAQPPATAPPGTATPTTAPATPEPSQPAGQMVGDSEIFGLAERANKIVTGGSGRFIIAWMPRARKVAVFDVQTRQMQFIAFNSDDVRISASRSKLFIAVHDVASVGRWDLLTCNHELSRPVPAGVFALASGEASEGPLLVIMRGRALLLDPYTLQPADMRLEDSRTLSQMIGFEQTWAEASADGNTFLVSSHQLNPQPICLFRISGKVARSRSTSAQIGYARPNDDGSIILGQHGLLDDNLSPIEFPGIQEVTLVPMRETGCFLAFDMPHVGEPTAPVLYSMSDRRSIVRLPMPPEATVADSPSGPSFNPPLYERLQGMPSMKLMANLDTSNQRLIVHKWDLEQHLKDTGRDYLFVRSTPPRFSRSGPPFHYQIDVLSRRGGLTYAMESGPRGMFVLADGLLRWQPPATQSDDAVPVVVRIKDGAGNEIRYSFKIWPE